MAERFLRAHKPSSLTGTSNDRPSLVNSYSTRGGMVGNTVRVTRPSRSSARRVSVSMRCEIEPKALRSSLKRLGPSPKVQTTSTVHLLPTRASTSLAARQPSGSCRLPGITGVPSCARPLVIYLGLVTIGNHQIEALMSKLKIAIVISTTRAARFGHKPAQWLRDIGGQRDDMEIEIVDLSDFPMPFF